MEIGFLIIINVCLLSRLIFLINEAPLSIKRFVLYVAIQLIALFILEINVLWTLLLLFLIGLNITTYLIESELEAQDKLKYVDIVRFISLVLLIIGLSIFFTSEISLSINGSRASFFSFVSEYTIFTKDLDSADIKKFSLYLFGALLVMNELNFLIRTIFKLRSNFKLDSSKELGEDKAGRYIGIIERLIIYIFAIFDSYSAIGIIMAAKGIARFEELKKRPFAEYYLLGTLASTLLAIIIAIIIQRL